MLVIDRSPTESLLYFNLRLKDLVDCKTFSRRHWYLATPSWRTQEMASIMETTSTLDGPRGAGGRSVWPLQLNYLSESGEKRCWFVSKHQRHLIRSGAASGKKCHDVTCVCGWGILRSLQRMKERFTGRKHADKSTAKQGNVSMALQGSVRACACSFLLSIVNAAALRTPRVHLGCDSSGSWCLVSSRPPVRHS